MISHPKISFFIYFQLETSLNPNWDINDDSRTVFYVKANGQNDTLHYIWNFNRQPSVLVALTQLNTNVTFKWNEQTKDTEQLTFSDKPKYTMSFVLTKVSDQPDNHAILSLSSQLLLFSQFHLVWQ